MRRELSPEETKHILFLQKENGVIVDEMTDGIRQKGICISDDYSTLRQAYDAGYAVIVCLDKFSKEQEKDMDCSFVRYAIDNLSAIDMSYLQTVYCRCKGIPRVITQTDRLLIKEMSLDDMDDLIEIFDSNEKTAFFEPFYGSKEEAGAYLNTYISDVYCYYDYGIWGAYLKDSGKMIGIAGFTPRSGTGGKPVLELGYAVAKLYQGQGYAKEACKAVVAYVQKELEYDEIIKVTSKGIQKIIV